MAAELYDPYRHDAHDDPYPIYQLLRDEEPAYWNAERRFWALSRFADVWDAVHDPDTFSSARGIVIGSDATELLPMMIMTDPPRHDRLRSLVSRAFTPKRVAAMEQRIRAVADELIDGFGEHGCDLIADFAGPLPTVVIAEMLGVPAEDREEFKRWSNDLSRTSPGTGADMRPAIEAARGSPRTSPRSSSSGGAGPAQTWSARWSTPRSTVRGCRTTSCSASACCCSSRATRRPRT